MEHFFNVEELNGDNKYQYIDQFGNKSLHNANKYYTFKNFYENKKDNRKKKNETEEVTKEEEI